MCSTLANSPSSYSNRAIAHLTEQFRQFQKDMASLADYNTLLQPAPGDWTVSVSDARTSPKILVIDDDPDVRATVEQILLVEGYTVTAARNGEEALRLLDGLAPDVILLDLMMPVMDGWEFRRRLQDHPAAATPVIIVSADRDLSRKAAAIAADGFIAKPFDLDHLLFEVGRFAPLDRR